MKLFLLLNTLIPFCAADSIFSPDGINGGEGGNALQKDPVTPPRDKDEEVQDFSPRSADLGNGAVITLDITVPSNNSTFLPLNMPNDDTFPVRFEASAHADMGAADVHYIYVMDKSGSTGLNDGACGTILECMEEFFYHLHREIEDDNSAKMVSLIEFDYDADIIFQNRDPTNPEIGIDILNKNVISDGGTCCECALNKTLELTEMYSHMVTKTVVLLAGDGTCDTEVADGVPESLKDAGAVVHTIAVGDAINCTTNSLDLWGSDYVDFPLSNLTTSDGKCFDLADPNDFGNLLKEITHASLTKMEIKVDEDNYTEINLDDLSVDTLPQESPIEVKYSKVWDMEVGEHVVCFRATGSDVSTTAQISDCRNLTIYDPPTEMPKEASTLGAGAVIGIVIAIVVITSLAVLLRIGCIKRGKDHDYDTEHPETSKTGSEEPQTIATGIPVEVV